MSIDKTILKPEVSAFIKANEHADLPELILKGSPFESIKIQTIAQQIKGKQVAKQKFSHLYENEKVIYPPKLNLEQSSSQTTAAYKADLINKNEVVADLTGGMGIDAMAFSKKAKAVFYCEISKKTFNYATHNFKVLGDKINCFLGDGIEFIRQQPTKIDWIYIDPARRDEHNKKVFRFEQCTPDITEHFDLLKAKAHKLLIKASPLIDLDYCISVLSAVKCIHIVSLKNEVKEILIEIDFNYQSVDPLIIAVNLETKQAPFYAQMKDKSIPQQFNSPQCFLYEPHAGLMKSGFFGKICMDYQVEALAEHSHLFTSNEKVDFPGRRFEILKVITPKKALLKKHLTDSKANIAIRNYPLKPEQIKKKYGLHDGGSKFVFFTSHGKNEKIVIICSKIIN